jgi:hypothetical protein
MNFVAHQKDIIEILIALGIPALLMKYARRLVERMPTKWHVVDDKLVLKGVDVILRHFFGTAAMMANAKPNGARAAELLIEFKKEYDKSKKMPASFNDGVGE